MAQAMRSAATGKECRAASSGRRAAAPRVATPAAARLQQVQPSARAAALVASPRLLEAYPPSHIAFAAAPEAATQQQASGTKVRPGLVDRTCALWPLDAFAHSRTKMQAILPAVALR
jgi:hypothetical protein